MATNSPYAMGAHNHPTVTVDSNDTDTPDTVWVVIEQHHTDRGMGMPSIRGAFESESDARAKESELNGPFKSVSVRSTSLKEERKA